MAPRRPTTLLNVSLAQFGRLQGPRRMCTIAKGSNLHVLDKQAKRRSAVRTILITGGAGFVGASFAVGLRKLTADARVVALDNLKRRGSELNLPRLREAGVEFHHGDIRNPEDVDAVGRIDLIIEGSAEPSVLAGYATSPRYLINTNLVGMLNCLELARLHGAAMIFLSTSRVYPIKALEKLDYREEENRFVLSDRQTVPGASANGISEAFTLEGARSLYGATKLCAELMLEEYIAAYGLKGVINRCGLIAGPWQMGKIDQGVVTLWVARHLFGGELNYIGYGGSGRQVRDMLHIDDLIRLVWYQMNHLDSLSGEVFNVGGGLDVSASLRELTQRCQEVTGKTLPIGSVPQGRPADVPIYITDHRRVTDRTGWRPEKGVSAILRDIHDWISTHKETLRPILA